MTTNTPRQIAHSAGYCDEWVERHIADLSAEGCLSDMSDTDLLEHLTDGYADTF